jgi:hypothetical protein
VGNIEFRLGDVCAGRGERFDVIVSNPPVAEGDPHIHDLRFEPKRALIWHDGLDLTRMLVAQAPQRWNQGLAPAGNGHDQDERSGPHGGRGKRVHGAGPGRAAAGQRCSQGGAWLGALLGGSRGARLSQAPETDTMVSASEGVRRDALLRFRGER